MKKAVLLAAMMISSTSAFAFDESKVRQEWQVNRSGVSVVASSNKGFWVANFNDHDGGFGAIVFTDFTNKCLDTNKLGEVIWDINGTNVRMTLFCGDGTSKFVAKNSAGEKFIVDEFKKKTVVVANEVRYSAKGFISATKKQKQLSKNAL